MTSSIDSDRARAGDKTSRLPDKLRGDCAACCGLCCVVHPFDAAQGFGYSKPAHTPCTALQADNRCSIYADRAANGFGGCTMYDCYGAGQWVAQHIFPGLSWRSSPETAARMFEAFRRQRALHELMAMLTLAIAVTQDTAVEKELGSALQKIEALSAVGPTVLKDRDIAAARKWIQQLLRRVRQSGRPVAEIPGSPAQSPPE